MTDADRAKRQATRKRTQTAKQEWEQPALASPAYVARKLAACVRLARQCSRDSWQCPTHRAEFLRIKRESFASWCAARARPTIWPTNTRGLARLKNHTNGDNYAAHT